MFATRRMHFMTHHTFAVRHLHFCVSFSHFSTQSTTQSCKAHCLVCIQKWAEETKAKNVRAQVKTNWNRNKIDRWHFSRMEQIVVIQPMTRQLAGVDEADSRSDSRTLRHTWGVCRDLLNCECCPCVCVYDVWCVDVIDAPVDLRHFTQHKTKQKEKKNISRKTNDESEENDEERSETKNVEQSH